MLSENNGNVILAAGLNNRHEILQYGMNHSPEKILHVDNEKSRTSGINDCLSLSIRFQLLQNFFKVELHFCSNIGIDSVDKNLSTISA